MSMAATFTFTKDELLKALWWNGDSPGLIGSQLSSHNEHGWRIETTRWYEGVFTISIAQETDDE